MFILLPIVSFFLFWFNFYRRDHHGRLAFLYAALLWGGIVWLLTETLSFTHALTFSGVLGGWLIVMAGACCWTGPYRKGFDYALFIRPFKAFSFTEKFILFLIISIAVLKGISAVYSAPNNSDALCYHLTRVEHWIQNHTAAYYPTHVTRQLYSPPWAEYAILQFRILSGGDYFSNAVQWFAAMGAWVAVSGLAQLLGVKRQGQLVAVLLAACLPMGLVQQTSTQTDYVLTFWLAAYVYLLWSMYRKPGRAIAFAGGVCLGLALLTKGTAYLLAPVWAIVFVIAAMASRDTYKLKLLALMLAAACVINIPYAARNTRAFARPYWTHTVLTNQDMSPSMVMANMARGLALHINFREQSTGEDDSGNELYLILTMAVLLYLIFYYPRRHKIYLIYGVCIVVMFIVLSAVVRPNPFNSRYQLAIFVLSTPLVGAVLTAWLPHRVVAAAMILMYMGSWAWLFKSNEHPLIGDKSIFVTPRTDQYFSTKPMMAYPYTQIVNHIASSSCRDIGLISNENEWGYPWWVLFRREFGDKFRIEDVQVNNKSSFLAYPRGPFDPCALIASNDERTMINLSDKVYSRIGVVQLPDGSISVFARAL